MQHQWRKIIFDFNLLCRIGMVLAFVALMTGCANKQQPSREKNKPAKSQKGEIQVAELTAADDLEVRAEFSAAMKFIKSGKYDSGIELLNKVTARAKNNSAPYINLAIAYAKVGNLKLAEENFKLALNIAPENPVASNEYAILYRKTGRFGEARDLYEKTLEKYPGFYMARRNLGILCDLYMRDYACALKHYEIYSSAMPGDKTVKIWISDIQKRLER